MYYSSFSRKLEEKLYIKHCSISTFVQYPALDRCGFAPGNHPFLLFRDMDVHNLFILEYFTAFLENLLKPVGKEIEN